MQGDASKVQRLREEAGDAEEVGLHQPGNCHRREKQGQRVFQKRFVSVVYKILFINSIRGYSLII